MDKWTMDKLRAWVLYYYIKLTTIMDMDMSMYISIVLPMSVYYREYLVCIFYTLYTSYGVGHLSWNVIMGLLAGFSFFFLAIKVEKWQSPFFFEKISLCPN